MGSVITAFETLNTEISIDFVKSRLLDSELKMIHQDQYKTKGKFLFKTRS